MIRASCCVLFVMLFLSQPPSLPWPLTHTPLTLSTLLSLPPCTVPTAARTAVESPPSSPDWPMSRGRALSPPSTEMPVNAAPPLGTSALPASIDHAGRYEATLSHAAAYGMGEMGMASPQTGSDATSASQARSSGSSGGLAADAARWMGAYGHGSDSRIGQGSSGGLASGGARWTGARDRDVRHGQGGAHGPGVDFGAGQGSRGRVPGTSMAVEATDESGSAGSGSSMPTGHSDLQSGET